jgi:molecular chaperone HscB
MIMKDYFEVFGLPRRVRIDLADLQARFYTLSRRHHPDFHQGASPAAQAEALEASALVNAAYRTLRDPIRRMEYLVVLEEGRSPQRGDVSRAESSAARGTERSPVPSKLLSEMFEIQEALQEAKTGDLEPARRAELAVDLPRLIARREAEETRLGTELAEAWDASAPEEHSRLLQAIKEALATRAYLRTVIEDLTDVIGEGKESHVPHRRH